MNQRIKTNHEIVDIRREMSTIDRVKVECGIELYLRESKFVQIGETKRIAPTLEEFHSGLTYSSRQDLSLPGEPGVIRYSKNFRSGEIDLRFEISGYNLASKKYTELLELLKEWAANQFEKAV